MKKFQERPYAALLALFLLPGAALGQTLYKSVGPDGRVSYSDRPPAEAKVQKTLTYSHLPASPVSEPVRRDRQGLEKSLQRRIAESPQSGADVQLFTAAWCGYCRKAKAYLGQKGIAYQEHDIDTPSGKSAFAQTGAGTGIPLLLWKGKRHRGFSKTEYDALFEGAK